MTSPPRNSPGSGFPFKGIQKYHVIVEAEGADGLEVSPGAEVSFVLKRHGKVSISPCAEVWDDGVVYWDAKCSQVCTLVPESDRAWRPKPCEIQVQAICFDSNGEPIGIGETVARTSLDLANYCAHDSFDQPTEPQKITLDLMPSGIINVHVSSIWLKNWNDSVAQDDACSEVSALSITPAPSTASLCPEGSSLTLGGNACDTSTAASSPNPLLRAAEQEEVSTNFDEDRVDNFFVENIQGVEVGEVNIEEEEELAVEEEKQDQADDFEISAAFKTPGVGGRQLSATTSSGGLGRSSSGNYSGSSSDASFTALQRRCKRLARERDEARAESFAEASVAVQRGIEIDNLKRAKDMLLQRLETTEMQLMMAMRMDLQGSPSTSKTSNRNTENESAEVLVDEGGAKDGAVEEEISSVGKEDLTATVTTKKKGTDSLTTNTAPAPTPTRAPYGDSEAVVLALVDAKVCLATKEFEIMELQGQLRAKEVYAEALSQHLAAVRAAAEDKALALASPASTTGGRSMRSVWHTPSITPPWSTSSPQNKNAIYNDKQSGRKASPLGNAVNTIFSRSSGTTTPTAAQAAAGPASIDGAAKAPVSDTAPVVHIVAHAETAEIM